MSKPTMQERINKTLWLAYLIYEDCLAKGLQYLDMGDHIELYMHRGTMSLTFWKWKKEAETAMPEGLSNYMLIATSTRWNPKFKEVFFQARGGYKLCTAHAEHDDYPQPLYENEIIHTFGILCGIAREYGIEVNYPDY